MRVVVIGSSGFVGSAFVRLLAGRAGIDLVSVTRPNYSALRGTAADVVVEAACNSRKYLADHDPVAEFDLSVTHRLRTLHDFRAPLHLHVSSVDVYANLDSPATTCEDTPLDPARTSRYGLHKFLAEELVRAYAREWLIVRLAGMVGPGLRKNPVFDILNHQPLRIHPDSQYQFMNTDDAARIAWQLLEAGRTGEIFNVCGDGLVSPREAAAWAARKMDVDPAAASSAPRLVDASIAKLKAFGPVPRSEAAVRAFLASVCP